MAIRDLFKSKLDKEKERIGKSYSDFFPYLKKEYLKIIPDEKLRRKIYEYCDFYHNPKLIDYFFEIYKHIPNFAIMELENRYSLNEKDRINVLKNVEFIKDCLEQEINLNNILLLIKNEETKNYFEIYGKKVLDLINKYPNNYKEILNNELFQKLDINFIIENPKFVELSKKIELFEMPIKIQENFWELYINNKNKFLENYENIKDLNFELIYFLNICSFDPEIVNLTITLYNRGNYYLSSMVDKVLSINELEYRNNLKTEFINKFLSAAKSCYEVDEKNLFHYKNLVIAQYTYSKVMNNFSSFYNKKFKNLEMNNLFEMLKKIDSSNSIDNIKKILKEYNIQPDPLKFYEELKEYQRDDLNQCIFSPTNLKNISKNDEDLMIIDDSITDLTHYSMLIHAMVKSRNMHSPNAKLVQEIYENPEKWSDKTILGSDLISCSKISENDTRLWGTNLEDTIYLGFSNLENIELDRIKGTDAGSKMDGSGKEYKSHPLYVTNKLVSSLNEDIWLGKYAEHNEIAFGRIVDGQKIKPSYILIFKNFSGIMSSLNESSKKWARYFDIPIVVLDGNKIKETAQKELSILYNEINKGYITQDIFYNIMLKNRTIENVNNKRENLDIFLNKILDIVIANPTPENIFEIQKILRGNIIQRMLENDSVEYKEEMRNEIINLRNQKINIKIAQVNELLIQNNMVLDAIPNMGRGFISFAYILVIVVLTYIAFLVYNFFK